MEAIAGAQLRLLREFSSDRLYLSISLSKWRLAHLLSPVGKVQLSRSRRADWCSFRLYWRLHAKSTHSTCPGKLHFQRLFVCARPHLTHMCVNVRKNLMHHGWVRRMFRHFLDLAQIFRLHGCYELHTLPQAGATKALYTERDRTGRPDKLRWYSKEFSPALRV